METLHFHGTDFLLSGADISPQFFGDLCDCGASGDATEAVEYVMSHYAVTGSVEDCRAYLAGYGAWDDEQLADHQENLRRLVWLTGCAMRADGEAYFSTY